MFEPRFKVLFLAPAVHYLDELNVKAREKIYANIYKSRYVNDPELLKKCGMIYGNSEHIMVACNTG